MDPKMQFKNIGQSKPGYTGIPGPAPDFKESNKFASIMIGIMESWPPARRTCGSERILE